MQGKPFLQRGIISPHFPIPTGSKDFLCLLLLQVIRRPIFKIRLIDYTLLSLFFGLGLLTFSRGGIFAAIIATVISLSIYFFHGQYKTQIFLKTLLN